MLRGPVRLFQQTTTPYPVNAARLLATTRPCCKFNQQRTSMGVPNISQVRPGAAVSIVLKADQPTGREVTGQVQDVLTKGNHPRGIKVRLHDGRIGRVQRMLASGVLANSNGTQDFGIPSQSEDSGRHETISSKRTQPQPRDSATRRIPNSRDVRFDGHHEPPTEQIDLMAYVKPAKQKKGRRQHIAATVPQETVEATCPVCEQFTGDQAAVAHHVETHFRQD